MELPKFDPDEQPLGEVVELPPGMIAERIADQAEPMDYVAHARNVADFEDVDGLKHRASLDEVEVERRADGRYDVYLKSHKKQIVMIGGALLFAAGVGVSLQFNRTHRKKKKY